MNGAMEVVRTPVDRELSELEALAERYETDKLAHDYCRRYETHFADLRDQEITLLEVGVFRGGSLRMWADYFPRATIIGLDIDPLERVDTERVRTVVVDVNQYEAEEHYDIVIDDGSHHAADMVGALNRLWPFVKLGGWYVLEDLQTQFSTMWGGGPGSPALARIKGALLELLHDQPTCPLAELHAYGQIVFLRKIFVP